MARDRSSIVKQSRREGYPLHPKAHKAMARRSTPPGQHGRSRQSRPSQYAIQLREKQKVKRIYGLLEKQFKKLFVEASRRKGQSGATLLEYLELRLDNTVYRAGFAVSRRASRQLVTHGHFEVNGIRVDIPSYRVKIGDKIIVRKKSQSTEYFKNMVDLTAGNEQQPLGWVSADQKKFEITVTGTPQREEVEPDISEQLIVEYYSR